MTDLKSLYEKLSPILRDQARYEYTDELAGAIIDAIAPEIEASFLARIAELEAALLDGLSEAFVEEMVSAGWIMRDIESVPAFRAARAALNGEKG